VVYSIECQDDFGEKVVIKKAWEGTDAVGLIEYQGRGWVVKQNGQLEVVKQNGQLENLK